jgi:anti-anti-sigma factor
MTEHAPLEIAVTRSDGIDLLEVRGRLTIGESAEQLTDVLQTVVERGGRKVNLNGVPQIDSSGISSLVRMSIQLAREGGALHIVCGHGRVRDALTVTRLVEAIPTFESDSSAIARFN